MKLKNIALLFALFSSCASAENIRLIPKEYTGLWADSTRTCKTKYTNSDYMLLVNITPKMVSGQLIPQKKF